MTEQQLRRRAERHGFRIIRADGAYMIVDIKYNVLVSETGLTLEEVEAWFVWYESLPDDVDVLPNREGGPATGIMSLAIWHSGHPKKWSYAEIPEPLKRKEYKQMIENAGHTAAPTAITHTNLYQLIIEGSNALDNSEVPETGRSIIITPDIYMQLKKDRDVILETDIGNELRLRGVIAILDGLNIIRVPANRVPADFGFLIAHPVATVNPVKLESYLVHQNPPFINGDLVEGRINYDAFVLENKAEALYYQAKA